MLSKKYCGIPIKEYIFINGFKHKFWIPYAKGVKKLKPLKLVHRHVSKRIWI
jgi:hypothetical protein